MTPFEVIIPCKGLRAGKSRLAEMLSARARERLCRAMLEHTVRLAFEAAGRDQVTVVSADADALAVARELGARAIDDQGRRLNEALAFANASRFNPVAARSLIILPIDLPLVTADLLYDAAAHAVGLGVAPDAAGTGTNLLVLAPELRRDFPFAFGEESFRRHHMSGLARGSVVSVLRHARIAFDLDTPGDIAALFGRAFDCIRADERDGVQIPDRWKCESRG